MSRLVALALTFVAIAAPVRGDEFRPLFNGKDLTGWEGDAKLWSVKDGAIVGQTDGNIPDNTFLLWKGTAGDFELHAKFRMHGGNSGIQYRSKHLKDRPGFVVGGYQADMDADNAHTGILYEEKGRGILANRGEKVVIAANGDRYVANSLGDSAKLVGAIKNGEWNDYVIVATGNKVTHTINGTQMVEVVDHQADKRALDGIIALQLHRGFKMVVEFKDIQLKKLRAGKILTPEETPIPPGAKKIPAPKARPAAKPAPAVKADAPADPKAAARGKAAWSESRPAVATKWLWLGKSQDRTVYFRHEFTLPGGATGARLFAAGDDAVTVYLDGKEVAATTDWQKPAFKDVSADLSNESSPRIKGGRHVLAAKGTNARSKAGVLVRLVVESGNGDPVVVATDETWRASDQLEPGWQKVGFNDKAWASAEVVANLGDKPWAKLTDATLAGSAGIKIVEPSATPAESLKVAKGFKVELLYSVPKATQGSWVNLCVDPKGRLITSDQYGPLYRISPPAVGTKGEAKVERIPAAIGEAQGMVWAFDALYVVVNRGNKYSSGLYRVTSSNHDDVLDKVELLRKLDDGAEHGPHAVILAPDGQSLYVLHGNKARMTELSGSRVPRVWGEDHILPRMPDGKGFMRGVLAPGACVYKVDRDGKNWELVSMGYRNPFDMAFNRDGDLFTYDADMEWDFNTPWYRPTRVCLVASGTDYGWRNGAGKYPPYYVDTPPPVHEVGPGSPTGVAFGYGAKFPAKYQDALFMCDWSYGKLYAVHLTPDGSSYKGEREEFVTGTPLPLTDVVVNPIDGAMYFTIGGRRTKSGLYRVTYTGPDVEQASRLPIASETLALREERHRLEAFHGHRDPTAVATAWPYLNHPDRFIRYAARVAIEWQDPAEWRERALAEIDPLAATNALIALVRVSAPDPFHRKPSDPPADPALRARIVEALARFDWDKLDDARRLDLIRVYSVLFNRLGRPEEPERQAVLARLDPHFPARNKFVNGDLCQLLVYLDAPFVIARSLELMEQAPTQEEQIEYAKSLRVHRGPWTIDQRKEYFAWLQRAHGYKGGASFAGFLRIIRDDAVATLTPTEKELLGPMVDPQPIVKSVAPARQRPFVKHYTVADLAPIVEKGLAGRDFDRGRKLFGEATCFSCHRYDNDGGAQGPDLTQAVGRFSPRDLLESIVEPSKEISDQYAAVVVTTSDGRTITGRIVNLAGDSISLLTDLTNPSAIVKVDRKLIESQEVSKVSMMPEGLLDTFTRDEVLDLVAYLLSRADRQSAMYKKK